MTRAATRSHFHRSRLVRTLADLGAVETAAPGAGFAEQLGQWLDIGQAIALRSAHNAPAAPAQPNTVSAQALEKELNRVRTVLEAAITPSPRAGAPRNRLDLPRPKPGAPLELASAFEPYRRYYLAHQREMDLKIPPLRARLREALAGRTPALAQLAALDAALDATLSVREAPLLAGLPALLEGRFKQLRQAHLERLEATQEADQPERWMQPGGWLAGFCQELQSVLLAELDLRLQPSLGLLEALNQETRRPI
ncbi:MAG: DUF3348 domain-containing protein [Rhodoferax sp.]|nr:DUF3348 domain-containing protein [Rhodoferax sp.]